MFVAVMARGALDARSERLTVTERAELARSGFGPRRRDEWIAGRVAAHRALGAWLGLRAAALDVLTAPDGAPRVDGGGAISISLSHDGEHVAVALSEGRAAVDLCCVGHADRLRAILARLGVETPLDPCSAWAALECALKLRRRGVTALVDARLAVDDDGRVRGLGAEARVRIMRTPAFALACAEERP
jgi:hypothetical protein